MKDNFDTLQRPFRTFVAGLRELLRMPAICRISGRPKKKTPPAPAPLLPGLAF